MRVIPVLDLRDGRAVHARGGQREDYSPVQSPLAASPGDALALALAYHDVLGCEECYVADLEAIGGAAPQWALLRTIVRAGARWMVDVGCRTVERAQEAVAAGASRVVVGLETLDGFDRLAAICAKIGRERVVFSLDLRAGRPIIQPEASIAGAPLDIVEQAVRAGAQALVLLDLARVGTGAGVDLELVSGIRTAYPDLELAAGGGVQGPSDLERAAASGLDGLLVATAIHDGCLSATDVQAIGRGAGTPRRGAHAKDSR
jgi:phosphoribosylformimino-5-aminoimidazole carboxamide ribotide isomerase